MFFFLFGEYIFISPHHVFNVKPIFLRYYIQIEFYDINF